MPNLSKLIIKEH